MKNLHIFIMVVAFFLSHLMCVVGAYNYRDMLCGIAHSGYSAPAHIALLTAIPFAAGSIICGILAYVFRVKAK